VPTSDGSGELLGQFRVKEPQKRDFALKFGLATSINDCSTVSFFDPCRRWELLICQFGHAFFVPFWLVL
jgi:hypothetical protein